MNRIRLRGSLVTAVMALGLAIPGAARAQDAGLELTTTSDAARQHFQAGITDALNVFPSRAAMHFGMALEADPDLALARVFEVFTDPALAGPQRGVSVAEAVAGLTGASTNEMLVGMALKELTAGNVPTASRLFETAAQLMPGDPYVASLSTQFAGARGDQTDAIVRWQAVADAFPKLANPHNTIAYQQFARGNEAAAMASVEHYVELAPDHPNAADSHAELLQMAGRYPEALAEYRRTAELDASFNQAYMGAAEVLFLVGAGDAARDAIEQAIEHAPSDGARVTAMRALANTYMIDGVRDGAMGQLEQAAAAADEAAIDGARAITRQQMALTDAATGDGRFVAEYLEEAAAIGGAETPVHLAISGLAYAGSNQVGMARTASEQLAEASAAPFWQSLSHAIEAMCLLQEDDAEGALAALGEANPGDPIVQAVMAETYDRLDRPRAADAMREKLTGNRQINLANPFLAFALAQVGG